MPKITKRLADRLEPDPDGRDRFFWDSGDGATKGFGVRVKPSGVSSYIVQYRNKGGRTRRLALGRVGVLTPDGARSMAKDRLGEVANGGDPSADRSIARKSMTVASLCDLYLEQAAAGILIGRRGQPIKRSTLAMDRSRVESHVKPLLGTRPVRTLLADDIKRMQSDIAAGRTVRRQSTEGRGGRIAGGRGVASRTVGMLGTILQFAVENSIIKDNPVRGVRRMNDAKPARYLELDEVRTLGAALLEAASQGENETGIAAVRALLLTGCRRMEMLALTWDAIDAPSSCLRLTDTKSGPQLRPIGAAAVSHLIALEKVGEGRFVFPANRGNGHFVGLPRVLARISRRAGIDAISVHALRHTFAAAAASLGYSELTIAGLLGHKVPGVTARYAHVPDSALVAAADRVASHIDGALFRRPSADVVPLRTAPRAYQ